MYSDVITTLPFTVCAADPKLQRLRPRTTYNLRTTTTTTAEFGVGRHVVGKAVYSKIRAVSTIVLLVLFQYCVSLPPAISFTHNLLPCY